GVQFTQQAAVSTAEFSPGGKLVFTGGRDGSARRWDAANGQPIDPLLRHPLMVQSASIHPRGHLLLTASEDGTARVWDHATGEPYGPPLRHGHKVMRAFFSADGKHVISASWDRTIRTWKIPTPIEEDLERITLWVQVLTGQELDAHGAVHVLDPDTWRE